MASLCLSEVDKKGYPFAAGSDRYGWMKGSWWLREDVSADALEQNTTLAWISS